MAKDIKAMLQKAKSTSYSKDLNEKIQSQSKKFQKDERFWTLTKDKDTGKGEAIIRFLPSVFSEDEFPYVKYFEHYVRGDDNRWLVVDACSRSLNRPCPICERASKYYQANMQDRYRLAKARTNYLYNILVVDDKACPENNGKVFMFKAGVTIHNMIVDSMNSEFDDEAKNPFGVYDGNNFIFRSRKDPSKGGQIAYDKSKFDDKSTPIAEDDDAISKILEGCECLTKYVHDANARWTDLDLERRAQASFSLDDPGSSFTGMSGQTSGVSVASAYTPASAPAEDVDEDDHVPFSNAGSKEEPKAFASESKPAASSADGDLEEEEDAIAFFRNLAV